MGSLFINFSTVRCESPGRIDLRSRNGLPNPLSLSLPIFTLALTHWRPGINRSPQQVFTAWLLFWRGPSRYAWPAHLYYAFRAAFPGGSYRQNLRPINHLSEFADCLCGQFDVSVDLDPGPV